MGLFKRWKDKPQASAAERKSFKNKLKYGSDPKQMYDTAREHREEYYRLEKELKPLLQKILKSPDCRKTGQWSELDIKDHGDGCKKSPIGKHVYMNVYGSDHPDRWEATNCICCDTELYRASKKPEEHE